MQKKIIKVLIEEQGAEESEYESDLDAELSTPESKREEPKAQRIFKYLRILDTMVTLPPPPTTNALTLFFEIDDVFLNTFICDENFGYMANPAAKDPEHEFFMAETRQPVRVYERDHMRDLLAFLK
jgi:TFIIF-interacting CTD phosphatase-like protein